MSESEKEIVLLKESENSTEVLMDNETKKENYSYVLCRTFLGGISNTVSKTIINEIDSYFFIMIRHFFITLLALLVSFKSNIFKKDLKLIVSNKSLLLNLIIANVLGAASTILFYNALLLLPVSIVSVYQTGLIMVLSVLLSVIFLNEKINAKSYIFIFLSLIGLFFIVSKGSLSFDGINLFGIGILTFNAFICSVSSVFTASNLKLLKATTVTSINSIFTFSVASLLVILNDVNLLEQIEKFTLYIILFMLYNILSGYLIKFLHNKSIQSIGNGKTSVFKLLTPIFSSLIGMIVFKEWFNFYQWIGFFLIIISLYYIKNSNNKG